MVGAEDDENKTVRVIGAYGSAIDYVNEITISWSEFQPSGLGPGGTCIRSGVSSVVSDSEVDEGLQFDVRVLVSLAFVLQLGVPFQMALIILMGSC